MTTSVVAQALRRDAAILLEEYRAGRWVPDPAEHESELGVGTVVINGM